MGEVTDKTRARWNTEPIPSTGGNLYSCLWCGAAICRGSAIRQHELYHETRGDYKLTDLRDQGVGRFE